MSNEFHVRGREGLVEQTDAANNTVWLGISTLYRNLLGLIPKLSQKFTDLMALITGLQTTLTDLIDRITQLENASQGGVLPTEHNQLIGIQGGTNGPPAERYHLTSEQRGNVINIPDLINQLTAILILISGGNTILPPVDDITDLPLTCTPGQLVFVRNENRFFKCNGDGLGWSPLVVIVGGGGGSGGTRTTFQDIMAGRFL